MWTFGWWCGSGCDSRRELLFSPSAFFGGGVLLRSAARRACVLLSYRVGRVFPGWRAWWVGWRYGRLLRIFSHVVRYLELSHHAVACAPGSLRSVVRGFWCWVRVLGHLQREGTRTGRFPFVSVVRGVARFLWWRYFVVIVDVPLVGCAVVGCLFSCRLDCESGVCVCVSM